MVSTCLEPCRGNNIAFLLQFKIHCHPKWDFHNAASDEWPLDALESRSPEKSITLKQARTDISRILFILTDGRISINSSEAMNSSSAGVMDDWRLTGSAMIEETLFAEVEAGAS